MESSQPLAIDSFSHSWLTSINSSLDGLDELLRASLDSSLEATSKELEYKTTKSKRFLEEVQNFNFDVPICQSPDALVHADQLFSDGLIKPIFINQSKIEASNFLDLAPAMPSISSKTGVSAVDIRCHSFIRWRRSLQKCFGYLRTLCHRIGGLRKSIKVDDIDGRAWEVKRPSNSPGASPRQRTTYLRDDWCDIESSIYEAVLHCKRSMGMFMLYLFSNLCLFVLDFKCVLILSYF